MYEYLNAVTTTLDLFVYIVTKCCLTSHRTSWQRLVCMLLFSQCFYPLPSFLLSFNRSCCILTRPVQAKGASGWLAQVATRIVKRENGKLYKINFITFRICPKIILEYNFENYQCYFQTMLLDDLKAYCIVFGQLLPRQHGAEISIPYYFSSQSLD